MGQVVSLGLSESSQGLDSGQHVAYVLRFPSDSQAGFLHIAFKDFFTMILERELIINFLWVLQALKPIVFDSFDCVLVLGQHERLQEESQTFVPNLCDLITHCS